MAGGTWSATQKPVLPGLYLNFVAAALAGIQPGARGVVIAPVKAHWGPVREFKEILKESDIYAEDAYTKSTAGGATAYDTLRFALMGGAKKIRAYRIASSNAAKASVIFKDTASTPADVLKILGKYPGTRGNDFKGTTQANANDTNKQDLVLYEGSTKLYTFTWAKGAGVVDNAVKAINDNTDNKWITAEKIAAGNDVIENATKTLSGGHSGTDVAAADYTNALTAFETQEFNLLMLDGQTDSGIQTSVKDWVKRVRGEGKGAIVVMGGPAADDTASDAVSKAKTRSSNWNHEGVVNVGTGVKLSGTSYSSAQAACYVAGLVAGQKLSESVTYAATGFEDVTRRWTRSEMEDAVKGGVLLPVHDGRMVKILRGMNTRTTLEQGQNNSWKKIRTIRVMDAINADLMRAAEDNYIGKVNNTEEGRLALVGACKQYMLTLVHGGVIEADGWDVYLNPVYHGPTATITPEPDEVYIQYEARLTDVVEFILGEFRVK